MSNERASIYQTDISDSGNTDPRFMVTKWVKPGNKVLDVGCACGDLGVFLNEKLGCEVYGLDYNSSSIEIAERTKSYSGLHQVDLNTFSPSDYDFHQAFDVIIICDVLEHLVDPLATLQKLKYFLKKDGRLLLSVPNVTHASIKILLLSNKIRYTKTGLLDETHLHFFTWRTLYDLLACASLEVDATDFVACGINGGYPGDILGYINDKRIIQQILRDDESYVFQYLLQVSVADKPMSFKRFVCMIRECFAANADRINRLRLKDLKKNNATHPYTLQFRYADFRVRILLKRMVNAVVPSTKRENKISKLSEKTDYLKQALGS